MRVNCTNTRAESHLGSEFNSTNQLLARISGLLCVALDDSIETMKQGEVMRGNE
jgi:hypothetical protein